MINFDINPVLFSIGAIQIRWYGLFYIMGFIIAFFWLQKHKRKLRLSSDDIDNLLLYQMIGLLLGSRIFFFTFYSPKTFSIFNFLAVWNGGMSFHGAFIGIAIATILFLRNKKTDTWKLVDTLIIIGPFVLAIGRLGNLINHELAGIPFDGAWCMVFTTYDNLCRHPYPIYALLSHLLLFAVLLYLYVKKKHRLGTGIPTAVFLIGYGILRIITDFWKVDGFFWFLKTGQWLSVFMIIIGIIVIFTRSSSKNQ